MFNPNSIYKWDVDVARSIYTSNPEANATWEYIYDQICIYLNSRNVLYTLQNNDGKKIVKINNFCLSFVSYVDKVKSVYFRVLDSIGREILDEAYDHKSVFGLPVSGMVYIDDIVPIATIVFMDRNMWQSLDTPQSRELEKKISWLNSFISKSSIED